MATPPFVRDALFHCQQVVEKAMKALLTWHDSAFWKTHNLEELGELCTRIDGTLAPAVEDVTPLTEYSARFRYPGAPWDPTLQEARESIELARTFVHTILKRLPPRVTSFNDRSKDSMESVGVDTPPARSVTTKENRVGGRIGPRRTLLMPVPQAGATSGVAHLMKPVAHGARRFVDVRGPRLNALGEFWGGLRRQRMGEFG
jgi:HEPN domain-containing protein